jgi:hypothetical protein
MDQFSFALQYEKGQATWPQGPLASFAAEAYRLARANPLAVSSALCGHASKVSSGLLLPATGPSDHPPLRLKSVSRGAELLLLREYDRWGRLSSVRYPDGQAVRYRFGDAGQCERIDVGSEIKIEKRWDETGNLAELRQSPAPGQFIVVRNSGGAIQRCFIENDGLSFLWDDERLITVTLSDGTVMQVNSEAKTFSARLSHTSREYRMTSQAGCTFAPCPGGGTYSFSPLGIMRLNERRRVVFWLKPDGMPMWFIHDSEGRLRRVWTLQGVTLIDHGANDSLSVLSAAGDRYVLSPAVEGYRTLIGPDSVSLIRNDAAGRTLSVQGMWGNSVRFGYRGSHRRAWPHVVTLPQHRKMMIAYSAEQQLQRVYLFGQGQVEFQYAPTGELNSVTLDGESRAGVSAAIHAAGLIYCLHSADEHSFRMSFLWSPCLL